MSRTFESLGLNGLGGTPSFLPVFVPCIMKGTLSVGLGTDVCSNMLSFSIVIISNQALRGKNLDNWKVKIPSIASAVRSTSFIYSTSTDTCSNPSSDWHSFSDTSCIEKGSISQTYAWNVEGTRRIIQKHGRRYRYLSRTCELDSLSDFIRKDLTASFFVGDAAGRNKGSDGRPDFSGTDRKARQWKLWCS